MATASLADVNVDGKPDLIIANGGDTDVGVLLDNGDGSFQPQKTFAAGTNPYSVAVADINGDGRPDIVIANQGSNTASVLLGDVPPTVLSINRSNPPGPITSDSTATFAVTFSEPVTGVDATDFSLALNGTTVSNPVVVGGSGAIYTVTISGILGNGTLGLNLVDDGSIQDAAGNPLQPGGSAAFQALQTFAVGSTPMAVVAADMNGDGRPDLVVANFDGTLSVLLSNGNGTFQAQQTFATRRYSRSLAAADVNGDGKVDLVLGDMSFPWAVSVLLGNGNGTFKALRTVAVGSVSSPAYPVAVSDVNGDGKPDILAVSNSSNIVSVLLGQLGGSFAPRRTFAAGPGPSSVAVCDVNADGKPDLVIANRSSNTVSVLIGNGTGRFQSPQTFAVGSEPISAAVADVNGDGKVDILAPSYSSGAISMLLGNGDGTFRSQTTLSSGARPTSIAIADINGDGKLDLALAEYTAGQSVGVALGNGDGTFQSQQTLAAPLVPLILSDVNGDGTVDLFGTTSIGAGLLCGNPNGSFTGELYTVVPPALDTLNGTAGVDQITLVQEPDHAHIDWITQSSDGQLLINDPSGLTVNGNDSNDVITLDLTNGNPLPKTLHLSGTFTIYGLQFGSDSWGLRGTAFEVGRSTVFINYAGHDFDPLETIQRSLSQGYNNGAWNGTPTISIGAITALPAAQNAAQTTTIGYADSADGLIAGQPANTIELKYTLYGDTNLAGTVGFNDFTRMTQHWNQPEGGTWDIGDFNYDGRVNSSDFTLMTRTYNTSVGNQAVPAVAAMPTGAAPSTGSGQAVGSSQSASAPASKPPTIQTTPAPVPAPHKTPVKQPKRRHR